MHLYLPHVSIVLLLITLGVLIQQGGFPVDFRQSRALQTIGAVWAFWLLFVLTQRIVG